VSHSECETEDFIWLDEVDLCRKVARNFEADFLLANFGLRPGLHGFFLQAVTAFPAQQTPPRAHSIGADTFIVRPQSADRLFKVKARTAVIRQRSSSETSFQIKAFHVCVLA
jgi:hypothetical protein